jgi:hypothetical protein
MKMFHSNTYELEETQVSTSASSTCDVQGEDDEIESAFDGIKHHRHTRLSPDEMQLMHTSIHYVEEYLNGLRAFNVLVTPQMLMSLSGFLGTFMLMVLKFGFGVRGLE